MVQRRETSLSHSKDWNKTCEYLHEQSSWSVLNQTKFTKGLEITDRILVEARKKDDKHLMVETQLLEAKIFYRLENLAKAKVDFAIKSVFFDGFKSWS